MKVTEPSHLYDRTITTGRDGSDDLETCVSAATAKYGKQLQVCYIYGKETKDEGLFWHQQNYFAAYSFFFLKMLKEKVSESYRLSPMPW